MPLDPNRGFRFSGKPKLSEANSNPALDFRQIDRHVERVPRNGSNGTNPAPDLFRDLLMRFSHEERPKTCTRYSGWSL